jgi:hypothetical protein
MQNHIRLLESVQSASWNEDPDYTKSEIGQLFVAYQAFTDELERLADCVPGENDDGPDPDDIVAVILQERARLMDRAATLPVQTEADALALLAFWHAEKVEEQDGTDLSAADNLVRSVCGYFGIV